MSPSKRSRQSYHHGDLRNSLVKAARDLLAETHNSDFSLREVAARAGVSHNAPYNHFADKNQLLAAVATSCFEELREHLLKEIQGIDDPTAALIKIGVVYAMFGMRNPAHFRLMFSKEVTAMRRSDPQSPLQKAAINARNVGVEIIRRCAIAGVFAVSPRSQKQIRIASLTVWSTIRGLTTLSLGGTYMPSRSDARLAEQVATMCCYGLLRRES